MDVQLVAAVINARVAVFNATLAGMVAANEERLSQSLSPVYGEEAFIRLIDNSDIHHNAIYTFIQGSY